MKIKFSSVIILSVVLVCGGCGMNYAHYQWAGFSKNGTKAWKSQRLEAAVKKDMLECGYVDVDNYTLPLELEAKAQICMNQKGWVWAQKNACDTYRLSGTETCKKHRGKQ